MGGIITLSTDFTVDWVSGEKVFIASISSKSKTILYGSLSPERKTSKTSPRKVNSPHTPTFGTR